MEGRAFGSHLHLSRRREVLLIVLCIMNVLSALFVEMALQIKDRDLLIQAHLRALQDGISKYLKDC